jgi:sterol-4alpha-carboxylate 3-dehydrogenase (decarboxylating)
MKKTPEATRILVTGGAGFVGKAIVTALVQKHPDWKVTVIDVKPANDDWESPGSAVDYEQVDIRKAEECYNVVSMCDPHVIMYVS